MKLDKDCFKIKFNVYQSRVFVTNEFSLVGFLNELVVKKCFSSLELECKMKNFAYSSSTKLIYQHFCKTINLKHLCLPRLSVLLGLNKTELINSSWSTISQKSFAIVNKKSTENFFTDNCVAFVILANLDKVKDIEVKETKMFPACGAWTLEFEKSHKKLYSTSSLNKLVNIYHILIL